MNRILILAAIGLLSFYSIKRVNAQINELSPDEISDGWILLFDGKTTEGWRGFKMEGMPFGWKVVDGCLVTSPGDGNETRGDIITNSQFEDFELYLEWAVSPEGNSGIFFNVQEGDFQSTYASGPEYQLIDDGGYTGKLEDWQQTGANYAMHPADPAKKKLMPAGEFNSSRIRVEKGHVTHWLNGEIIVEYDLWTKEWHKLAHEGKWKDYPGYGLAESGHIGLQDHGSVIRFRSIKLKVLD